MQQTVGSVASSCSVLDLGLASLDRNTRTVVPSSHKLKKESRKDTTPPPTRSPPLHIAGATRVCYRAQGLVADITTLHQLSVDDIDALCWLCSFPFSRSARDAAYLLTNVNY